jgi:hypothetical protein
MADKKNLLNNVNRFALLDSDGDSDEEIYPSKTNNNKLDIIDKSNKKDNSNNATNSIEEQMFKQYYGKKQIYNNKLNKNTSDPNGFITVSTKKKDKCVIECIYKNLEENILDLTMPNYFRVLVHHNDDKNWDYLSYHNITIMQKWGDVPRFLNTLNVAIGECKYTDFDIFIMKNEISPMWEDPENRNGSICSIKIDSLEDAYELLRKLTYHMVNNTLVKFNPNTWNSVNGLSYSSKKMDHLNINSYCVILKIWFKINMLNFGTIEKLLNDDIANDIGKYSIKMKAIKPEY